jgi:hypothetical protein
MKRLVLAFCAAVISMSSIAQTDTANKEKVDTIHVGGMIIIKKTDKNGEKDKIISISNNKKKKRSNVSTNWWIFDIGFANVDDKTNYAAAQTSGFLQPGVGEDNLELRTGKSLNVNIWAFMQKVNIIKHVVNLKYGLGVELNNYHFDDERIRFQKNPTRIDLGHPADLKKNKLAVDYVTAPIMLNFNLTPQRNKGFGFSAGVSGGYLYSARQKIKNNDDKDKVRDDFDLNKWKVAYIGEVNLGQVRLYGSYATRNMWEKGLDQTPYSVGIRFSNW